MKQQRNFFWAGLILMLLGGILFALSLTISVTPDSITTISPLWGTAAALNSDESVFVIADSSVDLFWIDKKTDTVEKIINVYDLGLEDPLFYNADFDENDDLYVHVADNASSGNVDAEYLLKITDAKIADIYTLYEGQSPMGYRSIFAMTVENGVARYIKESPKEFSIIEYDLNIQQEKVIASFDFKPYCTIISAQYLGDGSFLVTNSDGSIFNIYSDGRMEDITRFNFKCNNYNKENVYPGSFVKYKDSYYFIDDLLFNYIYKYDNGKSEIYSSLNDIYGWEMDEDIHNNDYLNNCVDYSYAGIFVDDDALIYSSAGDFFIVRDDGTEECFYMSEGIKLNSYYCFMNALNRILYYGAIVLSITGVILILIHLIFLYFSVLNKILFIMIPIVVAAFAVITVNVTSRIEKMYIDSSYQKLISISELGAKNLDLNLLNDINDLDDVENGNVEKLKLQLADILKNNTIWGDDIFVSIYRYDKTNVHRLLVAYPETEEAYLNTYFLNNFEKISEDRVGESNTYATKTIQPGYAYIDAITIIYDGDEPVALFDVYSYNNSIVENVQKIRTSIIYIALITTAILIALLLVLANFITSNLRRTKKVVDKISDGDLKARVNKITKDEVGVVATGVNDMADRLEELFASKEKFSKEVIETLVGTIDAKDKYTNGHSLRVAKYSREIAARLGKSKEEQDNIYYAGLLHDIGKIAVPDEIINKTSRLDDREYSIIKTHPEVGFDLLKNLSEIKDISIGAYGHHERYDGKGYPRGLKGEENPETARIISVADAYDAMTSNRSYRNAMSQEKVRGEIEKGMGTQFDPKFADIMLAIDDDIKYEIYGIDEVRGHLK